MGINQFLMLLFAVYRGHLNKVNLMKLVLCAQKQMGMRWCDFVPVQRGGYSFGVARICEKLEESGVLEGCGEELVLGDWEAYGDLKSVSSEMRGFLERLSKFGDMGGQVYNGPFVAYVYGLAPEFAVNSTILDDLHRYDDTLRQRVSDIRAKHRARLKGVPVLTTIGYEGYSLDRYLRTLLTHGVTVLADVRKNPVSRCFGFSKSRLERSCRAVGIAYRHLPNLGIASEKRQALCTQADYDALFADYERTVLPNATEELETLAHLLKGGERVALTCFEANALQCHRTRVARRVTQMCGVEALSL